MLNRTEIERLAKMAHALRPDWPVSSLCTILNADHRDRAYADVAIALAVIATDPATKTPKRLSESGPWWSASQAVFGIRDTATPPRHTDPRCTKPGHEHELAHNCRSCRADNLAAGYVGPSDPPAIRPDQASTNASGAALVRAAMSERSEG